MNIYDIAREAGVSITTVSRVLNQSPNIRQETRQKVQAVLEKYHYSPSPIARGLVKRSMNAVGILSIDIRGIHYSQTAYAIEQELHRLGYRCQLYNTGREPEQQRQYLEMIADNLLDGIILIGSTFQTPAFEQLLKQYLPGCLPVLFVNGSFPLPNVYSILSDDHRGIFQCVEQFIARGRRHILFVRDNNTDSALRKERGYRDAMTSHGLTPLIIEGEDSINGGANATRRALELCPQAETIFYGTDRAAVGGIQALQQLQIPVPAQVELIGFNNSQLCEVTCPALSSLDNHLDQMGLQVAQILHRLLQGEEAKKISICTPVLAERESTRRH